MPQYYFDLKDRNGTTVDEEGLTLRDLQAARNEAALALGVMARDAAITALDGVEQLEIEVRDDDTRALGRKSSRDGLADTGCRAGHECSCSPKVHSSYSSIVENGTFWRVKFVHLFARKNRLLTKDKSRCPNYQKGQGEL